MRLVYHSEGAGTSGSSHHNTRIESLWAHVNKVTLATKEVMYSLVEEGLIDVDDRKSLLVAQLFFST